MVKALSNGQKVIGSNSSSANLPWLGFVVSHQNKTFLISHMHSAHLLSWTALLLSLHFLFFAAELYCFSYCSVSSLTACCYFAQKLNGNCYMQHR